MAKNTGKKTAEKMSSTAPASAGREKVLVTKTVAELADLLGDNAEVKVSRKWLIEALAQKDRQSIRERLGL